MRPNLEEDTPSGNREENSAKSVCEILLAVIHSNTIINGYNSCFQVIQISLPQGKQFVICNKHEWLVCGNFETEYSSFIFNNF